MGDFEGVGLCDGDDFIVVIVFVVAVCGGFPVCGGLRDCGGVGDGHFVWDLFEGRKGYERGIL